MNERRVSLGNRALSLLLALVMVIGMLPLSVFSVFAADSSSSTTQSSLASIQSYASNLLNSNFSKTSSAPAWDTEGKSDTWRYYNGVMLDALLMLGVDSNAGNALEYAKDFMDANIDSSGKITDWHANELDSVPPALTLISLLGTAEVDDATRADYITAINYVYAELENQTSYDNCGGNMLHKDSWDDWNIGLDGIYMAQPFLMAYANALEAGKLTNTVNSKTASDIYKEVHDRLVWVADTMYDTDTKLYHHGWSVSNKKGNGHFWSRGIGWYAAGLVMCIDRMPAGTYKENLISKLPKLFDGMLQYQDDSTGLWYNVVNRNSSLTDNNGNKLETSGSALMAYAMIKSANEGWVTDAKYATAGIEAFNGIVTNKLKDGKITDIYKSSGVETSDGAYCKNSYVSDEAKGVGPVIMAAAEVDKYLGNNEDFAVGVVVAPSDMTVAAGATTVDTSKVKVSLLGGQGSIANGVAGQMAYEIGAANNGKATVTVKNGDATIGTFQVNVVDPSTPATGEGTLPVQTGTSTVPSNPSFTAGDFVQVHAASEGSSGSGYVHATSMAANKNYVISVASSGTSVTAASVSGSSLATFTIVTNSQSNGVYNIQKSGQTIVHWQVVPADGSTFKLKCGNYYLQLTGKDSSDRQLTTTESDATAFNIAISGNNVQFKASVKDGDSTYTVYLKIDSGAFRPTTSSTSLFVFTPVASDPTPAVYAKLTGTQGFVYPFGEASGDIITDIKASTDFKVLVADNDSGNGATEVAMSNSLVTVEKNSDYKDNVAKTNNFIVKYDGVQIGTIPVVVYDSASGITNYDVDFAVTPGAVVANVGDANKQLNVSSFTVGNLNGIGYTVKYSGGSSSIATVTEDGLVSFVGAGSTTITATVVAITYDGKSYDSADFGSITATIPVVVNAEAVEEKVTYSLTGLSVLPNSVTVGDTAQATATAAASDASGNHSYTFTYAISGSGASINASTGAITTTAAGTYTVTATLTAVDGSTSFEKGTVTKTATLTVAEAASYTYTILGSNGSALAGQSITLNKGETYSPSFTVKQGDTNVTTGYTMTLEATSNASAVTISGTTITANQVAADTVVNIRATVAPNTRASAEGTSVDFTVTVKASTASATGNISTSTTTGGTADSTAPVRDNNSSYVEIVAPSTTTTGGSSTTYVLDKDTDCDGTVFVRTKLAESTTSTSFTTNSYGITATAAYKMTKSSSAQVTINTAQKGTLVLYYGNPSDAGRSINVTGTNNYDEDFAAANKAQVYQASIDVVADGSYQIFVSETMYLIRAEYTTEGSGGTTTTVPGEYAKLDGTKGYAFPFNTTSAQVIAAIEADNASDALKVLISANADGSNASALADGLANSRIEITKNASGPEYKMDIANTYYFGVTLDGKKIGEIPVKIYDPDATTGGTTTTTWYNGVLTLNPTSVSMTVGDADKNIADTLTATAVEGGANATINSFTTTWTSSNSNVATVDSNGNVHAVGAGTATITAKLATVTVNGVTGTIHEDITATATVNVTASGSDTPSTGSEYIHIFETHGKDSSFYTIIGDNLSDSKGTATVNGTTYDTCLKMNGNAEITFNASAAGTLTLVFNTGSSGKKIDVNGTIYTIPSNGILTIDVPAGDNVIKRNDGESFLYYMAFAENSNVVAYSLSDLVFNPASIYAGQSTQVTTTVTASDGSSHTYTLQWMVEETAMSDTGLSTAFTAMSAGEYTVTAKLTHVDDEELPTPVTKTGTITVADAVATGGSLNNTSVTVTQGTDITLSALSADITFSNNTNATVDLSQSGFTFKKNGSDISITDVDATVGTHTIAVYYNGVSLGNLTVTVNAPVTGTSEVSYVLDTDGIIEDDSEYLIVGIYNGTYYALTCNSSTSAKSTVVVPENGVITLEEDVASKVLWHFANQNADVTADNGVTYDCFQISNNGYYLQSGGANFYNSATSVYAAKVGDSDGSYEIALKIESGLPRALYCSSTSGWSRNSASSDRNRVVYLYKKVEAQSYVTLEKLPMLYVGGTPYQAKLSDYVSSVSYNGTTYTDYEIQWTSGNSAVAYITDDGQYVNGAGAGTAQLVAKLMSVGGKDVSAENIVATVDVSVTVPSLELGEDVTKFVGESFTAERQVLIGSTVVENYVLSWTSSNDTVATVDQEGNVSVVGEGTATIYAQIVSTNGNNISNYLTITDSFTVTAEEIAITSGKLSSETVTVALGADAAAVESALSGITLTLTKNNGETILVDHATLFDGVDLSGVNTAAAGTYYVDLTYSDPNSDYVFNGVVAVMVIDESLLDKEGVITVESGVTYVLDTDGIDANEEYVFVKQNSDDEWVAMMNPDATGTSSVKGSSQVVTRSSDGKTITVSANADLVRWMFTNKSSTTSNGFTYNTFTVKNNNRYLKGGGDSILGSSSKAVGVWYAGDGSGYYYVGTDYSSGKARALILSGDSWTRDDSAYPDDSDERVYLYKRVGTGTTYAVGFQVSPTEKTIPEGTSFTVPESGIRVQVGDTVAESYKIQWTTSDSSVATVDENGKITAKGAGSCTITATLVEANGSKVTNNATNTVGIPKEIAVTVQADELKYLVQGSPLTVPLGGEPDFSKVSLLIDSELSDDIVVPSDQLVFKYIDAVAGGFDTDVPNATCNVDVYYNGVKRGVVVLKVADNAYDGLDQATSYPEYPDPGAVRMNKFATGINFNTTGVAKIELNAAGISSRKPVDVVLIVDVSNSMNWSMDWFEGLTAEEIAAANDAAKTDSSKPDKLDMAMTAAQNFASILMENNVAGSSANNTMTFVTFGGNDLDRGGPSKSVDSVVTAFVGEDVLANVNNSFANTLFTGSQALKISGTDGNAIVSGDARGNTIYDAAFVEAMAAVEQLKIAKAGSVADYDASGREVHIIFMTDGAPSHYNDKCYDNSNFHDDWFTKFSPSDSNTPDDTEWLNFIKNPNADATELYNMVTGFHIVGYDLAHGGFGSHNWTEAELGRVLGGLVENKALDYTLATDTEKLNTFFDELGHSLAYAGTHALVTDIVSEEFILQTDPIDLYGDGSEMLAPTIEIVERQLVVRTDIGKTMSINGVNTVVTEAHLGMYVDGGEKILATVTFDTTDATNKKAFSTALDDGEDIWNDATNIITGKYFTYSFSNKTFEWKIGNIEDTEIALNYYGYLTGAKNEAGEGGRAEGIYATNEEATLKYINTDNQIVIREYPVPRIAWGKASATVRFFLVNEKGEYTNLAGNIFNNPANRIFLVNSATYQFDLNTKPESIQPGVFTALDAFIQAQVSGQYALYDDVTINVTNSTMTNVDGNAYISGGIDKNNTGTLVEFIDVYGDGSYLQTTINIPVVTTGRLGTDRPLTEETVVLDYGKPIDIQLFNHNELQITNYGYKMELYGFAAYDPAFDTKLYLLENEYSGKYLNEGAYFNAGFGHFKIIKKDTGLIEFHATSIAQGPVQVFAIAKISMTESNPQYNPDNVYYLYNPVTIVPATTVYYETDFADGHQVYADGTPFTFNGSWTTATEGSFGANLQDNDPDVNRRDDELNNVPHVKDAYGSDSSYAGDNKLSNGDSLKATGAGVNNTTVKFSFTGTGFDIISRTGANQGMIRVIVTDKDGNQVKKVNVTNKGTNELYQIPVVSVQGLGHGTYNVEIGVYSAVTYPAGFEALSRGGEFYFDAVRIYDTAKGDKIAETEYKLDGEYAPEIKEIGQLMVDLDTFTSLTGGNATGMLFMDAYKDVDMNEITGTNLVATYKTYGANNEIYLEKGQGVAFLLSSGTNPATIQIGAKSVKGDTVVLNAAVTDTAIGNANFTQTITTSTDMFYDLTGSVNISELFADGQTYVVIWNSGDGILSVTDIKIAYAETPVGSASFEYSAAAADVASNVLFSAMANEAPRGTLKKGEDGNWYYCIGGEADTTFTGLAADGLDSWYVVDGKVAFTYTGTAVVDGETYYIKGGKVYAGANGLYKISGNWYYFADGEVNTAFTGLISHNGLVVYVENGVVNFGYTGTASYKGDVYYVRYGMAATTFTGLVKSADGKWIYVVNGIQDTSYTGLAKYGENWWYVENGAVNFVFTGTVDTDTGSWNVINGQVNLTNAANN